MYQLDPIGAGFVPSTICLIDGFWIGWFHRFGAGFPKDWLDSTIQVHTNVITCTPKAALQNATLKLHVRSSVSKRGQSVSKLVSKRAREIVRWLQSKWGEIVWFVSQLCDGKSIMWWMTWKFLFKTIKMMAFKERVWGYGINHAGLLTAPNCHCCLHMSFTLILDELQNVKWPTLGTELYKLTVLSLWRVITQQVVVAL